MVFFKVYKVDMKIRLSTDVIKILQKIKYKEPKLAAQVKKQLQLFQAYPQQPSLRTHKLSGKLQNRWSISITKNIRMVYIVLNQEEAYFIAIGTHDQVYRK